MQIGSVELAGKAFLAPMAGVTDMPFRRICAAMGAALTYTEMVSAKGLLYSPDRSATLLARPEDGKPAALQLFGNDPALLADMAEEYGGGYALIDINMGCPVPKVVKAGQGSALMRQPELAGQIVRAVSDRVKQPVTVKFRKGWDGGKCNAVSFAQRMADSGAAAVAVHGRTREQFYTGRADWEVIAAVKRVIAVPVIGSGDLFTAEDALRMLEATGCDAVMLARGAQGNPWIFAQINALLAGRSFEEPGIAQRLAVAWEHALELREHKGERIAVQEMRKHLCWYIRGIPEAARWRRELNNVSSYADLKGTMEEIASSAP